MKIRSISLCVILILAAAFFSGCSKKIDTAAGESLHGTITFIAGDVKLNNKNAEIGSSVVVNDIITTGVKSLAVIQFSQSSIITVKSGSNLKIDDLFSKNVSNEISDTVQVTLTGGATFNKIIKKGTDFSEKTPTMVASVRGTSFEVRSEKKSSKVNLLYGEVRLTRVADKKSASDSRKEEQVLLTAGQSISVTGDKIEKPVRLNKNEIDELNKYNSIQSVSDIDKILKDSDKKEEVIPQDVRDDILGKKTVKKAAPGQDILSVIRTRDGKEYVGSFRQKGDYVEITTSSGKKTVRSVDIDDITRYRQ